MPRHSTRTPSRPREPRDTLVVLLPLRRDRDLAERQGWYRARPSRSVNELGNLTAFRQLLFYQPDSFGAERRRIEYTANVTGYERARRVDLLPDEPEHLRAEELYHCFELGPLRRLTTPILSRIRRRLLFVPTTASRAAGATDINDLFMGTPIEDRLFSGLREEGLLPERQLWLEVPSPGARQRCPTMRCLDLALHCRDSGLDVECDGDKWHTGVERAAKDRRRDNALTVNGWHILRFGTADIRDALPDAVACVREAVQCYGGQVAPE